ncbi:MFS transporter [Aspergillus steynii IBT 23096]|uniref:MFS transporter n=1 Tax=Aspergillus steynii IBT 23096 TaxID=1392250 RepID=A0A2I2G132_9EURO|nr:MFS transporter [Aspergillus steynii IBT 23096]PLB46592.1 MFS transporter [Aspergillus steynii IBT 23096]
MEASEKPPPYEDNLAPAPDVETSPQNLPAINERKLVTKIDWHIMPCLCAMVNIGNASIMGLKEELNIENGTKYNTSLTILFVPYIIFEIPSNILLKKFKPHVWLPLCMFGFGFVSICQGLVQNWGGLMTTRWFLGMFESGLVPGCYYLIGMWYKRSEAQKRFSLFFCSTTVAGAFGGLLASGIGKMDGLRGYRGWRWVFIIEGLLTCVVAIACYFFVGDFPEDAKWLTDDERKFAIERLATDTGKSAPQAKMNFKDVLAVFKDYKIFVAGCMYFGVCIPIYSYANFAPTIIKTYGYDTIHTQLFSIPPWVAAFVFSMVIAYLSDRFRHRYIFAMVPFLVALAGLGVLLNIYGPVQRHVQYGALFLIVSGSFSAPPVLACWFAMNLAGHRRRSVGIAWFVGFGNLGGIISPYCFLSKDAPAYHDGYILCIAFVCLSAATASIYLFGVWLDNVRREKAATNGSLGEFSAEEEGLMGDLAPSHRYVY